MKKSLAVIALVVMFFTFFTPSFAKEHKKAPRPSSKTTVRQSKAVVRHQSDFAKEHKKAPRPSSKTTVRRKAVIPVPALREGAEGMTPAEVLAPLGDLTVHALPEKRAEEYAKSHHEMSPCPTFFLVNHQGELWIDDVRIHGGGRIATVQPFRLKDYNIVQTGCRPRIYTR